MAIITMSAVLARAADWSVGQLTHSITEQSEAGAQAERVVGPPQWTASIRSAQSMTLIEAGEWQSVLLRLRGGVNVLELYDPVRLRATGTLRGTVSLANTAAAGSVTTSLSGVPVGRTLLPGDWLQVGSGFGSSQLVSIVSPTVADGSGVMPITFEPPLRLTFSSGTLVTTERCLGYYRMQGNVQSSYRAGRLYKQGGFAADFVETWR